MYWCHVMRWFDVMYGECGHRPGYKEYEKENRVGGGEGVGGWVWDPVGSKIWFSNSWGKSVPGCYYWDIFKPV